MVSLEPASSTPTETAHYNCAVQSMPEYLRAQEQRLTPLGQKDDETTLVFQKYHLPIQAITVTGKDGIQVKIIRALVDPEEYVIPVGKGKTAQLLKIVQEDQLATSTNWKAGEMYGVAPLWTSLEIVVGNKEAPETCYRYKVLDARATDDPSRLTFTVESNIEHEKSQGAYTPSRFKAQGELQELVEELPSSEATGLPSAVVRSGSFNDSQNEIMSNYEALPLTHGQRSGNLIAHQRAPQTMTRFADDTANLEIDLTQKNLWVVVASGDAVEANWKEKQKKLA